MTTRGVDIIATTGMSDYCPDGFGGFFTTNLTNAEDPGQSVGAVQKHPITINQRHDNMTMLGTAAGIYPYPNH